MSRVSRPFSPPASQPIDVSSGSDPEQDEGEEVSQAKANAQLWASQVLDDEDDDPELDPGMVMTFDNGRDLARFFDLFKVPDSERVALCRSYASYVVAKGRAAGSRKGPAPGSQSALRCGGKRGRFHPGEDDE